MSRATGEELLAILANPPLTQGTRTLRRVELAADLLGFTRVHVVNLFALPSHTTVEIAVLGVDEGGWLTARESLGPCLDAAHGVLLAYGATAPIGAARLHFGRQVEWLHEVIAERELPSWHVGDGPRHPSRWQRWTHREHPGVPFADALRSSFTRVHADPVETPSRFRQ